MAYGLPLCNRCAEVVARFGLTPAFGDLRLAQYDAEVDPAKSSTISNGAGRYPDRGGVALAARLQVMDRWPTIVDRPLLWDRLRCIEAFDYRWNELEVPPSAQDWYDRIDALETLPPIQRLRRTNDLRLAQSVVDRGAPMSDVNLGRGGRRANSLMVAAAVDSHLDGAPASALGWNENKDPVRVLNVEAGLGARGATERATSAAEVDRIVRSWGPGGKGVLSLRDPASVFLWVINAVNRDGRPAYFDYSASSHVSRTGRISDGVDAVDRANHLLGQVDPRSSFASVALWRTKDLAGATRLADDLFDGRRTESQMRTEVRGALPPTMPDDLADRATNRVLFFGDHSYALWLIEQLWRGALTLLPTDLANLSVRRWSRAEESAPADPIALTRLDQIVVSMAQVGHLRMMGEHVELVAPDTATVRQLAVEVAGGALRDSELDGIAPGCLELWLDSWTQRRLHEDDPRYCAPIAGDPSAVLVDGDVSGARARWRSGSWIDVNRVASPGQRRTNCWNCVSATATWIENRSLSTALPIYDEASYRPTIPYFLREMKVVGKPVYVNTKAEADAIARSWGPNRQGLVICSLTNDSTHIFNVVFDGEEVRFLDSHLGRDGDYNFDTDWMRIGVVALDRLCFES